jgi:hypothetical protein
MKLQYFVSGILLADLALVFRKWGLVCGGRGRGRSFGAVQAQLRT